MTGNSWTVTGNPQLTALFAPTGVGHAAADRWNWQSRPFAMNGKIGLHWAAG
jgi:hypothetical protein